MSFIDTSYPIWYDKDVEIGHTLLKVACAFMPLETYEIVTQCDGAVRCLFHTYNEKF